MQKTTLPPIDPSGSISTDYGVFFAQTRDPGGIIEWSYAVFRGKAGVGNYLFRLFDDGLWYIVPKGVARYGAKQIKELSLVPPVKDFDLALMTYVMLE